MEMGLYLLGFFHFLNRLFIMTFMLIIDKNKIYLFFLLFFPSSLRASSTAKSVVQILLTLGINVRAEILRLALITLWATVQIVQAVPWPDSLVTIFI